MEFTFENLDNNYYKGPRELVGDIQPKFWYRAKNSGFGPVLVKRQSSEYSGRNKPRSPMFNHFGEYFGYLLAEKAGIRACPVDLVTLHDTKNRYSSTIKLFTACASHSLKKTGTMLMPGEIVLSRLGDEGSLYKFSSCFENDESRKSSYITYDEEDNVDLVIAGIVRQTIEFEKRAGIRTDKEIKEDVKKNVQDAIDMIVYDCIFGNHDRHSGNWSMEIDNQTGSATMYPAYDNEAVLGLRKSVAEISSVLEDEKTLEAKTDNLLFSRMNLGKVNRRPTYKEMLIHLVEKYPEYAIPSIYKITSSVDEKIVESLYDSLEGISQRGEHAEELSEKDELPEVYKYFGMQAFKARRNYALSLIKVKPDQMHLSPKVVGGDDTTKEIKNEGLQLA